MKTLSFNEIINNIYNFINNKLIIQIFKNPILLSIIIVFIIIIIIYISKYDINFKNIIFNIIFIAIILSYHDKLKKQEYIKEGSNELTNYFTNIAENSNSNIKNIQMTNINDDNIDINSFFDD